MRKAFCLVLLGLSLAVSAAAAPSASDILNKVLSLNRGIRDYTATVTVDTNMPDLDIPRRTAKVYVKLPDKTYVESNSIVVIPKRALLFGDLAKEVQKESKVVLAGTKKVGNTPIYCLKLIPKQDTGAPTGREPRVLLWAEGSHWTVTKVQALTGTTVNATVEFTYQQVQGFWMPARVNCSIPKETLGARASGSVNVAFSNLRVNTGLTDQFFAKKEASRRGTHHSGQH
ncbi:hypothetical protein LLH03_09065 [bacterium]|nr:hypothetical protein [bacterium]